MEQRATIFVSKSVYPPFAQGQVIKIQGFSWCHVTKILSSWLELSPSYENVVIVQR